MRTRTISSRRGRKPLPVVDYPDDVQRPRTRGDCVDGPRPCPWVSCKYHLALSITRYGSIRVLVSGKPTTFEEICNGVAKVLTEMPYTCALDVADRGGMTLESIAEFTGLTRERVRQVEDAALEKARETAEYEQLRKVAHG